MSPARGPFTPFHNGEAMARDEVPACKFADFRQTVLEQVAAGRRVAAFFGAPAAGTAVELWVALADDVEGWLHVARSPLEADRFESLTPDCPQVHWFEREIAEQWGVRPEGHPWLKPMRFHASYRPGQAVWPPEGNGAHLPSVTAFFQMQGEEVHEVAVGPVHAGVIEPGHFRFQCH